MTSPQPGLTDLSSAAIAEGMTVFFLAAETGGTADVVRQWPAAISCGALFICPSVGQLRSETGTSPFPSHIGQASTALPNANPVPWHDGQGSMSG